VALHEAQVALQALLGIGDTGAAFTFAFATFTFTLALGGAALTFALAFALAVVVWFLRRTSSVWGVTFGLVCGL